MNTLFLGIVIFLIVLAVFDLVVGVSNDAVNFLNSAIGAKVARVPEPLGMLADVPRGSRSRQGRLRGSREAAESVRDACGRSAKPPRRFFTLADFPRDHLYGFSPSREFRKPSGGGRESFGFDVLFISLCFSHYG